MRDGGVLLERLRAEVWRSYPLPEHLVRTEWWLHRLRPGSDEAVRAAALLHDIDRLYPLEAGETSPTDYRFDDRESLLWHGRRSARFAERILRQLGAEEAFIGRVKPLIVYHELGGDEDAEALMEADSLSFLENNVDFFLRKVTAEADEVRIKVDYMFHRIRSEEARELARPLYRRVVAKLEALVPGSIEPDGRLDVTGLPRTSGG